MLQVLEVCKEFRSGDHTIMPVNRVSFSVDQGKFAAIVGKSGSGKSTLLALLGALDTPTSGAIEVNGRDITRLPDRQLTAYRRHDIGFVFQQYNLIPNLTALENVMLPMEFAGISTAKQRERAKLLLDQVGIAGDKQQRRPGKLSGGEQQRVAISRALANHPKLILADEPTGNLDSETGKMIFDLLHKLARTEGVTIVAVTHDLSVAGKCDVVFKIRDGRLTAGS